MTTTVNNDKQVFFISGASKGFGLEITNQLLKGGYSVAATSRNKDALIKAVDNSLVTESNFLPLQVDITSTDSIKKAIDETISKFTRIDVIINNAGYGMMGTIEELSDKEIRDNYEVNVFGPINIIKAALPHLRNNKHFANGPRIINISSIAGFTGQFPGFSVYCSTKFALDGLTEGLAEDVKEFGIFVSSIKPGYFRTSFLTKESSNAPANPIKEYTSVRKVIDAHQNQVNGNQAGDPVKGAKSIIEFATTVENPPVNIFLGKDSILYANQKIESIQKTLTLNTELTTTTDHTDNTTTTTTQ